MTIKAQESPKNTNKIRSINTKSRVDWFTLPLEKKLFSLKLDNLIESQYSIKEISGLTGLMPSQIETRIKNYKKRIDKRNKQFDNIKD